SNSAMGLVESKCDVPTNNRYTFSPGLAFTSDDTRNCFFSLSGLCGRLCTAQSLRGRFVVFDNPDRARRLQVLTEHLTGCWDGADTVGEDAGAVGAGAAAAICTDTGAHLASFSSSSFRCKSTYLRHDDMK